MYLLQFACASSTCRIEHLIYELTECRCDSGFRKEQSTGQLEKLECEIV